MLLLRSFLLALRTEGSRASVAWIWTRLFGTEEYLVFVRQLEPPRAPVTFPIAIRGAVVRPMREADLDEVAARTPFSLSRMPLIERRAALACCWQESAVAECDGRIVGAIWYTDVVGPAQPFYAVVEPHLRRPARLNAGTFVAPDANVGAFAFVQAASQRLASLGVRSTISTVRADNLGSIFMTRMCNATLVGRVTLRYRFGRCTRHAEPASDRIRAK